jgi:hypothetical protein
MSRRTEKQAVSRHPVCLDLSLHRVLSVEFVKLSPYIPMKLFEHAWALLLRSYQAAYYSVYHITVFWETGWRGF